MNKEQAKEEYIKIIKEVNKKQDAIIKLKQKKYLINGMKKRMKLRRKRRKMEFGKRKDLIQTIIFSKKLMKKQSWNLQN